MSEFFWENPQVKVAIRPVADRVTALMARDVGVPLLAAVHVWMAPAWQEIIWRAAQRSLAVMCPASHDGFSVKG
jgi:phage-related baseplate assembly protein